MKKPEILIVGGGPVGCLMAILLSRQGYTVKILERRPDIRKTKISAGRSINLALSIRGIHALRECGLAEEILARAVPMYGRSMHALNGELSFQRYGLDDSQYINSISRGELNKALLNRAEKESNISISFQSRLSAYDIEKKIATFMDESNGQERVVSAPTVIGADGSASVLRDELKKRAKLQSSESPLDYGYKEFTILPTADGGFALNKNSLHIWPRGSHMLIALPNFDGSFTCTLFLPWKGPQSFESLATPELAESFFKEAFPDALKLIDRFRETYVENPAGQMVTVRSRPWNLGEQIQLIGDAAHAIVPFFGQGLNCGFEDCTLFNEILKQSQDLGKAFELFSTQRLEDANAIADLALENFVEMRDKVGQKRFLLEKEIEKILMKKFPVEYVSKYSMVTFSRTPYRLALRAGKIQEEILAELSAGISDAQNLDLHLDLHKAKLLIETKLMPFVSKGSAS
jgi:kynurenine 3-monooxygenase